jgi:hypothetical protein
MAMFQGCYGPGVTLPANLCHILNLAEMKAVRCTDCDTCRFQTLINPVFAIIAFDYFSGLRIPLGRPPGTSGNTGFASYTQIDVGKNDTIFGTLLHGTCWTCCDTPRIFTVKTWHKHIRCPRKSPDKFRSNLDDLTNFGTWWKCLVAFAHDFAGMASNALFGILKKKVFTHFYPPNKTKTAQRCFLSYGHVMQL